MSSPNHMDRFAVSCVVGTAHGRGVLANPTLEVLATSAMLGDVETAVEYLEPKPVFGFCYNELHNV